MPNRVESCQFTVSPNGRNRFADIASDNHQSAASFGRSIQIVNPESIPAQPSRNQWSANVEANAVGHSSQMTAPTPLEGTLPPFPDALRKSLTKKRMYGGISKSASLSPPHGRSIWGSAI